jgi:hypothetical protein
MTRCVMRVAHLLNAAAEELILDDVLLVLIEPTDKSVESAQTVAAPAGRQGGGPAGPEFVSRST